VSSCRSCGIGGLTGGVGGWGSGRGGWGGGNGSGFGGGGGSGSGLSRAMKAPGFMEGQAYKSIAGMKPR